MAKARLGLSPPPVDGEGGMEAVVSVMARNDGIIERAILSLQRKVFGKYGISTVLEKRQQTTRTLNAGDFSQMDLNFTTTKPNMLAIVTIIWEVVYNPGGGQFEGKLQVFNTSAGTNFFGDGSARQYKPAGTVERLMCAMQWVITLPAAAAYQVSAIQYGTGLAGTCYTDTSGKMTCMIMETP